eukprot:gene10945-19586_t
MGVFLKMNELGAIQKFLVKALRGHIGSSFDNFFMNQPILWNPHD